MVHLNALTSIIAFELQNLEHYNKSTGTHQGRTDIRVVPFDFFKNKNAYYIIECKRLDGLKVLNKKYVNEGVKRFLDPADPAGDPLYPSYYGRNIMLGFLVKKFDFRSNSSKIEAIQRESLADFEPGDLELVTYDENGFSHLNCSYKASDTKQIILSHLFFDFADVIQ